MQMDYNVSTMDFSTAGTASSSIKKTLKEIGIDSAIIRKLAIATYEAEINIAIHSNGGKISLHIEEDKLRVVAEDKGPGIPNIELAMQKGYSTASTEARELGFGAGMGLPNMKKCCDDFIIDSKVGEFTRVEMIMNI